MKNEKEIIYFSTPGKENTNDCVEIAIKRAKELDIKDIVVASCSGYTAKLFAEACQKEGMHLIVVTHAVGFENPGEWEFDEKLAEKLKSEGHSIITGTHSLSGMERAISRHLGGGSRTEAIAEAFRKIISVGMKVAVECVLIAADQGAVPVNREVIAVGGTSEGADTVLVVKPSHTATFFNLHVCEFVAMPRGN
ncbi:MAG TPA: hypothetical protein O0X40_04450 [Methanocorpusculum sp.]|nr:hypothetical protein [Methanocorpusculum sp.]